MKNTKLGIVMITSQSNTGRYDAENMNSCNQSPETQGHSESSSERERLLGSSRSSGRYRAFNQGDDNNIINTVDEKDASQHKARDPTNSTNETPHQADPHHVVPITRARVVSGLAFVLYAMGAISNSSLLSQYLDHRWMQEARLDKSSTANYSVCNENKSDSLFEQFDDIQAKVTIKTMYYSYMTSIPAMFSCLLLGSYSDVFGRRMLFMTPVLGGLAKLVVYFFIIRFDLDTNYFFLAHGLDGLGGSFFASLIASYSISADISVGKANRIIWIVILQSAAEIITASASVTSGYLIDFFNFSVAIIFAICPIALSFLIVLIFLPETCPRDKRGTSNLWTNVARIIRMYAVDGSLRHRLALFLALILFFFIALTLLSLSSTDTLYQLHQPFCWDATLIGYYSAVRYAGQAILGGTYLKIMQVHGWVRDEVIAMVGMLFRAGAFIMEAFVKKTWTFFLGALFASVAVIETVCNILAVTIFNEVYAATVSVLPGAVYLAMAGVAVLTFFSFFIFFYFYDEPSRKHEVIE